MDTPRTAETSERMQSLKDTSEVIRDDVKQMGSAALDAAQQKYEEVKGAAYQKAEDLRRTGQDRAERLETTIRKEPLRSVLIASGIGFLLGMMFSRR